MRRGKLEQPLICSAATNSHLRFEENDAIFTMTGDSLRYEPEL